MMKYFTIKEVAEAWGVPYITVWNWVNTGAMDSIHDKVNDRQLISEESLHNFRLRYPTLHRGAKFSMDESKPGPFNQMRYSVEESITYQIMEQEVIENITRKYRFE